jgi:nicotinamide mononucleotide transporter
MQMLEICATVLGLLQGFFVLLNKRCNWLFYIAQIGCLICFSYLNRLYGDVLSNTIYLFMGIAGWILWKNSKQARITQCSSAERLIYVAVIAVGSAVLFAFLKQTQDPLPHIDAFSTVSSFVATYYMVRKKLDTWVIWFINDLCYIAQYAMLPAQAYYLMGLNIVWTVMAVISFFNWLKIMKGNVK